MVVVRQSDTIGALHVDGGIAAVFLLDLDVADGVTLAMDGETETGDLWEVTIKHGHEGCATGEHRLQLFGADHDAAQSVVVRQHADDVAIGDIACVDVVTDTAAVLHTDVGFQGIAIGICHDIAGIRLLSANDPLVVLVAHHEGVVGVGDLLGGDFLYLLFDVVGDGRDLCVLEIIVLALDELSDETAVGGNDELADIEELGARLGDSDLTAVEILHLHAFEDLMGVTVEHNIDATGVVDEEMRTDSQRLGRLTHMREQHHIVGSILTGVVDCLLDEFIKGLRLQVIEQDTIGIVEGVTLEDHRLRGAGAHKGHLLVTILMDDVRGIDGRLLTCLKEIGTDNGGINLHEQLSQTRHTIVELVVAQREGVVVHQFHDIGDVLAFGDGSRGVALQEVATTDSTDIGRILGLDGVTQTSHLRIAVDTAMYVVLVENHNALLSYNHLTAHHQSQQAEKCLLHYYSYLGLLIWVQSYEKKPKRLQILENIPNFASKTRKTIIDMADTLDDIDLQILRTLQKNAKLTTKELADAVHLTPTPVFERQKRLERQGYIKKYVAILDPDKLNQSLQVYCKVKLKQINHEIADAFTRRIMRIPEVTECYNTSGNYDYLLKVRATDMKQYQEFVLNKLGEIESLASIESTFVMSEIKQNYGVHI